MLNFEAVWHSEYLLMCTGLATGNHPRWTAGVSSTSALMIIKNSTPVVSFVPGISSPLVEVDAVIWLCSVKAETKTCEFCHYMSTQRGVQLDESDFGIARLPSYLMACFNWVYIEQR